MGWIPSALSPLQKYSFQMPRQRCTLITILEEMASQLLLGEYLNNFQPNDIEYSENTTSHMHTLIQSDINI